MPLITNPGVSQRESFIFRGYNLFHPYFFSGSFHHISPSWALGVQGKMMTMTSHHPLETQRAGGGSFCLQKLPLSEPPKKTKQKKGAYLFASWKKTFGRCLLIPKGWFNSCNLQEGISTCFLKKIPLQKTTKSRQVPFVRLQKKIGNLNRYILLRDFAI